MSYTITQAQIKKFDPEVKGVYQANSRLGGVFHENNALGASTYQVTRLGDRKSTRLNSSHVT